MPERVKTMLRDALDEGGARAGSLPGRARALVRRGYGLRTASARWRRHQAASTQYGILLVIALGVVGVTNADSFVDRESVSSEGRRPARTPSQLQAAAVVESDGQGLPASVGDPESSPQEAGSGRVVVRGTVVDACGGIPLGWTEATSPDGGVGIAGEARRSPPDCADAVARRVLLVRPALEGRPAAVEWSARATEGDARRRSSRGGRGQGDRWRQGGCTPAARPRRGWQPIRPRRRREGARHACRAGAARGRRGRCRAWRR